MYILKPHDRIKQSKKKAGFCFVGEDETFKYYRIEQ